MRLDMFWHDPESIEIVKAVVQGWEVLALKH